MFGHKSIECRSMPISVRNVKCYTCGRFGHVSNQFRSKGNQWNEWSRQINLVHYNCNSFGHIARFCRNKNMDRRGLVYKGIISKKDDKVKGKVDVEEIRD